MSHLSICIFLIIVAGIGCQQHSSQATSDQIKSSVEDLLSNYQAYVSSGNIDNIMSLYSEDSRFHWVEDGQITYRSAMEVKNGFQVLLKDFPNSKLELRNITVTPLPPDYATITVFFKQSLADSTGNGFSFSGAMTITAVKEQSGWKFLMGHASSLKER